MKTMHATLAACLIVLAWLFPAPSQATTSCDCANGVTVHTTDDDANACEEACEGMGGIEGPSDDDDDDDTTVVVPPRKDPPQRPRR